MKRRNKIFASLLLAAATVITLGACKKEETHEHTYGDVIAKVDATCTQTGVAEHYRCNDCNKYFVKENGEYVEKTLADLTLAVAGHTYADDNDGTCNVCDEKRETATYNLWDGTTAAVPAATENVITLTTAEQLAGLAKSVNEGTTYAGVTVKLAANIDLQNKEWTPIGYGSTNYMGALENGGKHFQGTFDGQNYTVYNLKITAFKGGSESSLAAVGVALFGNTFNATIKNLNIDTAKVEGNHFVAALVGYGGGVTVDNCKVTGAEINCKYVNDDESGDKAGALVAYAGSANAQGYATNKASVKNCSVSNSTVKADRDAGQVIGCLSGDAEQSQNTATATTVAWNESGDTSKSNTNITNDIVGRVS